MTDMITKAIRSGATCRAAIKAKCKRGALVTRIDAHISAMLFSGKIISVRGSLRIAN